MATHDTTVRSSRPARTLRIALLLALVAGMLTAVAGEADADAGFTDVPGDHPFSDAISWLVDRGATGGWADGTFRPTNPVTRQAAASFLYQLAGSPHGVWNNEFSDVPGGPNGHPFHDAISWLVAQEVAGGYADGTFRPTEPVSRQAIAAFLYRLADEPEGPWSNDFSDVPGGTPGHPFHDEISWLVDLGATQGYEDGTFRPANDVTRMAIASFLYQADQAGFVIDPGDPGAAPCTDAHTGLEPELPDHAVEVSQESGDLLGVGGNDTVSAYVLDMGGERVHWLRFATESGFVAELPLDDVDSMAVVEVLGVASIGGEREVAFVREGGGAGVASVGLWGLHDLPDSPCEPARVTAPDDSGGPTFPVGGTLASAHGLRCEDDALVMVRAEQTAAGTYDWAELSYQWPGRGALQDAGLEHGTVDALEDLEDRLGFDCPGVSAP